MKVTDERLEDKILQELIDNRIAEIKLHTGSYGWDDNILAWKIELAAFRELQSLRKIDIAETLKYAEEAGAVCEEMKYHIEKVREKIKGEINSIPRWRVIDIIDEHLTQYLDLED